VKALTLILAIVILFMFFITSILITALEYAFNEDLEDERGAKNGK